jgi:hypothetical protein
VIDVVGREELIEHLHLAPIPDLFEIAASQLLVDVGA